MTQRALQVASAGATTVTRRGSEAGQGPLTGSQRAAVVLAQLESEFARRVLQSMTESEVVELATAMASLPVLQPEEVRQIVVQFGEQLAMHGAVAQGGVDAARRFLRDRLGPSRADEVLLHMQDGGASEPLSFLHRVDPREIVACLLGEHPQVIALVLCHLPPERGANVVGLLEPDLRVDVARRVATMGVVSREAIGHVAAVLEQRLSLMLLDGIGGTNNLGGIGTVVSILNRADQSSEKQVLSGLDALDPELAEEIRNRMVVFEDVIRLDDRSMQLVLRHVAPKDLAIALKGVPDALRDCFTTNLSARAASDVLEEIEYLGPVRASSVESAQRAIVRLVRDLDASGDIVLVRGSEEIVV